jgi:uncharacterized protein YkwD
MNLIAWMRRLVLVVAVAFTALALVSPLASAPRPARAAVNCDVADLTVDGEEQVFLTLLNAYRQQNGAAPLNISQSLNRASTWMSTDMANYNYFSHTDRLGRYFDARMSQCDVNVAQSWSENLAAWYVTGADVFEGWKNSPGHNTNMLNPALRSIGISRVYNASSTAGWYWSTNFSTEIVSALPPPNAPCTVPSINVNPSTNTGTVGMAFTVTGGATCGSAPHFQFWVGKVTGPTVGLYDASVQWTPMQLYSANNTYTWIPNAPGYYYVTFWVKNPTTTPANTWFDTGLQLNLMTIN